MKRYRQLLIGILIGSMVFGLTPIIASTLEVAFNTVNIAVNGQKVNADNILYNGITYVPLRVISELLGKDIGWDEGTKTASINDRNEVINSTKTPDPVTVPTPAPKPVNSSKISKSEYEQIKTGMTYNEVCGIIGGSGELLSESDLGIGSQYVTKMYQWEGQGDLGANANAMFQGGKLISKAQYGLK